MKTLSLFSLTATTLLLIALPTVARQHDQHQGATNLPTVAKPAAKSGMAGKMPEHCTMMMQMHQKMESDTKVQDDKLKKLTVTMNQTSGDQKMAAMEAVLNELVAQRTARQMMMDHMQSQKMGHMMEHMQQGGKTSMMKCPMMGSKMGSDRNGKGMMGMKKSPAKP